MMRGPWDRQSHHAAFAVDTERPRGGGYYPAGVARSGEDCTLGCSGWWEGTLKNTMYCTCIMSGLAAPPVLTGTSTWWTTPRTGSSWRVSSPWWSVWRPITSPDT